MPPGNKTSKKYFLYGKLPLGKMPTRKKGLLKMPLQNILSTHGKKPRRKLPPGKSALKNNAFGRNAPGIKFHSMKNAPWKIAPEKDLI